MSDATEHDLGVTTRMDAVIAILGPVQGLRLVDVGCGEGEVARALAQQGATVSGYDPFLGRHGVDWQKLGTGSYRLAEASADRLPEADATADIVLFMYSLHHVPAAMLGASLAEARRVLKPGGRLCVVEPVADGTPQYVMAPYHDETAVRRDAAVALADHAAPAFDTETSFHFRERRLYPDFDAYAAQAALGARFNDYSEADVRAPEVHHRFDEMFALHGPEFDQPVRVSLFG